MHENYFLVAKVFHDEALDKWRFMGCLDLCASPDLSQCQHIGIYSKMNKQNICKEGRVLCYASACLAQLAWFEVGAAILVSSVHYDPRK